MKILFVIPTLFNTPELTKRCVHLLKESTKHIDKDIYVVINEMNDKFNDWNVSSPVFKSCSNLPFNISKAINTGLDNMVDHDYFCYIDEGMLLKEGWLEEYLDIYEKYDNLGVLGARRHSSSYIPLSKNLYETYWTDGIMLIKKDRIKKVGYFNEIYFGDCETQEYCYRLIELGYRNMLYLSPNIGHLEVPKKNKTYDIEKLTSLSQKSRKLFLSKWGEWIDSKRNRN